jgi:hypothetical protein
LIVEPGRLVESVTVGIEATLYSYGIARVGEIAGLGAVVGENANLRETFGESFHSGSVA